MNTETHPMWTNWRRTAAWQEVADRLAAARESWARIDASTLGPLDELVQHARLNAESFRGIAQGLSRWEAWKAAESKWGRLQVVSCYVRFALNEELPAPDETREEGNDDGEL